MQESATLQLAKALCAIPSVTPHDHGAQELLAQKLTQLGFSVTHFPIGQTANLWAKKGIGKPLFCFAGHTDVVPPGDLNAWESPPFTPTIREGKMFARGAADMKSSIAAMVTACERFIQNHPENTGCMAFLITSDEEGPADDGTQAVLKILETQQEIPQWCLVGEASSSYKLGDTIKVGRRGSMTGYLTLHGIQGHVAYPLLAQNPIHLSFAPLQAIAEYQWDQGIGPFPPTTLQFANIHAGTGATNVIPGILEANFNLRFCPQSTPETIKNTIADILQTHGCQYDIRWQVGGQPFYTAPDSPFVKIIHDTITQTMGYAPEHSTSGGTSDGRFFAQYGTHVVEVGPLNASIHQINEHIDIAELDQLSHLYEQILENIFII